MVNVDQVMARASDCFTDDELAQYRREGWVLALEVATPEMVQPQRSGMFIVMEFAPCVSCPWIKFIS